MIHRTFVLSCVLLLGIAFAADPVADTSAVDTVAQVVPAVPTSDSTAQHQQADSIRNIWFSQWTGKPMSVKLPKGSLKLDDFDPQSHRVPVSGKIQNGNLEFTVSGALAMDDSTYLRLRKAKDWKVVVNYHDRTVTLVPKKKDKRVVLIDQVALEFENVQYPVLGEIWLPSKVSTSLGYMGWRDSLQAQGILRKAMRGWIMDGRDQQRIAWLSFDSLQWFSRYLSWDAPGSYSCTMSLVSSACKRYDREDAQTVCPAGWNIPDSLQVNALKQAWLNEDGLPFEFGFRMWEIHSAESDDDDDDSTAVMLYTPWSDSGRIEPHYWSYFETYALDSKGQVGLFQFGWDESGIMSEFVMDTEDHVRHPVRCVKSPKVPLPTPAPQATPVPEPVISTVVDTTVQPAPESQNP